MPVGPPERASNTTRSARAGTPAYRSPCNPSHRTGGSEGECRGGADNFQRIKTYGGALSFDGIDGRLCDADLFGKRGL